jgi:hypothetical protein
LRIAAEGDKCVAHRREIDHGGNAGEILHQDARRTKGDLDFAFPLGCQPAGEGLDILLGDGATVFMAQQIFEQNL